MRRRRTEALRLFLRLTLAASSPSTAAIYVLSSITISLRVPSSPEQFNQAREKKSFEVGENAAANRMTWGKENVSVIWHRLVAFSRSIRVSPGSKGSDWLRGKDESRGKNNWLDFPFHISSDTSYL